METTNGMPVEINMQVVLVDTFYNVSIHYLLRKQRMYYRLLRWIRMEKLSLQRKMKLTIDFPPDRLDLIRNTRYAMVRGTFEND